MTNVDVRVRVKATNAHLAKLVDKCGSIRAAAEAVGVSPHIFSGWLNFRSQLRTGGKGRGPWTAEKSRKALLRVCELCECRPADVFPEMTHEELEALSKPRVYEHTVQIEGLLEHRDHPALSYETDSDRFVDNQILAEKIQKVLKTLHYREREILKLRFGLGGQPPMTLEEVGHVFKVTRDRIRQIEVKALRKLEQPSRSQELVGFLE